LEKRLFMQAKSDWKKTMRVNMTVKGELEMEEENLRIQHIAHF